MVKRLRDLEAVEVSLVPKGANRKKFLLFKSEEVTPMEEILKAILETNLEDEPKVDEVLKAAKISDKAQNAVKGALRLLNAYKDELPKDIMKTLAGLAGYGYPEPAQKQKGKDDDDDKKKKYGYPAPVKKEDGSWDFSGVPEDVRPMVEALWKEHLEEVKKREELERVLKEERDKQATKEFIQKAETEFGNLPTDPKEFGPVLKELASKAPEEYKKLEGVLKAANEVIEKGALFAEFGRSAQTGGNSALDKLNAKAEEIRKADPKLSRQQAFARAVDENPDLYLQYRREEVM